MKGAHFYVCFSVCGASVYSFLCIHVCLCACVFLPVSCACVFIQMWAYLFICMCVCLRVRVQMSVFTELLKLWPHFQDLRSGLCEEQLLSILEEQEQKHRAGLQRRRRREARMQQKSAPEVPVGRKPGLHLQPVPCTLAPLAASSGQSWSCSYSSIIFRRQLLKSGPE